MEAFFLVKKALFLTSSWLDYVDASEIEGKHDGDGTASVAGQLKSAESEARE